MTAVATIISNRVDSQNFPNDYLSVCTQSGQFSGYARGKKIYEAGTYDPIMWDYATSLLMEMVSGSFFGHPLLTSSYLYFHSEKYGNPTTISAIRQKSETVILGGNMFYINWP